MEIVEKNFQCPIPLDFFDSCLSIIDRTEKIRKKMNLKPYLTHPSDNIFPQDNLTILIHELYYSYLLHKGDKRKRADAGSVFDEHLMGTEYELANMHMTGMVAKLAAFKHDDGEDCGLFKDDLFMDMLYSHLLTSADNLATIKNRVALIVEGVSKEKQSKKTSRQQSTREQFIKLLGCIGETELLTGIVKIADRTNNIINPFPSHSKGVEYAKETMSTYVPLAEAFKMSHAADHLLTECVKIAYPDFWSEFVKMQKQKKQEFINPFVKVFSKTIKELYPADRQLFRQASIRHQPYGISKLLKKSYPFVNIDESVLKVDEDDPFFETIILFKNKESIESAFKILNKRFSNIANYLLKVDNLPFKQGCRLHIFNKVFGGRMIFRLNTHIDEALSRRGYYSEPSLDNVQIKIREGIRALLEKESHQKNIFQVVQEEFLMPNINVFSKNMEKTELPRGSTVLDYILANNLPLEVRYNCEVANRFWDDQKHAIGIFDELFDNRYLFVKYYMEPSRDGKELFPLISIDPAYLYFCNSNNIYSLKEYLATGSPEEVMQRGKMFVNKICNLFHIDCQSFFKFLMERYSYLHNDNDIYEIIGKGQIDILNILNKYESFNDISSLVFTVDLNMPKSWHRLEKTIGHSQIQSYKTLESNQREVEVCVNNDEKYNFLKKILKLSYEGFVFNIGDWFTFTASDDKASLEKE